MARKKYLLAVDKKYTNQHNLRGHFKRWADGEKVVLPSLRAAAKQRSEACFEIYKINKTYVLTYPFRQLHYHNWSGF